MTTESEQIHRRLREAVADMINEYRLQASVEPVGDKALEVELHTLDAEIAGLEGQRGR